MEFEFISNACGIFTSKKGYSVLTDPWLNDGVFDGSWCHFHKLRTQISDLQAVDGIYLSHIHPDHYDERYFEFTKDVPIFLLDSPTNFLVGNLKNQGYSNLVLIKDGESVDFHDFKLTMFAPFVRHNFFDEAAKVGNIIDSAIVIENEGFVAFNSNDNTPDQAASRMLKERFKKIDLAMFNYNSAGPYPACFNNLTDAQKIEEHQNNLIRNFEYMYANIQVMQPIFTLPFAGAYVLGGRLRKKNAYLGTTTWDACADYLRSKSDLATQMICLRENDVFDFEMGRSRTPYVPIDMREVEPYISDELSNIVYDYEKDDSPSLNDLEHDLIQAKKRMHERSSRVGITPDTNVIIEFADRSFTLTNLDNPKSTITCALDERLLRRILDRKSHWNNAEIGCHIEFNRIPNYYSPDTHMMLQFLHL